MPKAFRKELFYIFLKNFGQGEKGLNCALITLPFFFRGIVRPCFYISKKILSETLIESDTTICLELWAELEVLGDHVRV